MTTAAGMPGLPVGSAAAAGVPAAPEVAARDAVIGWFRGEFAAANAMIDALCGHLAQIGGGGPEYDPVFAAIHRRRANWFPVLHMQKFYPVADVAAELRRVADARAAAGSCCYSEEAASTVIHEPMEEAEAEAEAEPEPEQEHEQDPAPAAELADGAVEYHEPDVEVDSSGDSSERKPPSTEDDTVADGHHTDQGSQGEHSLPESYPICSDHEECIARPERIKIQKGFVAKESVKGHMVNVVKGLKIYEDAFTTSEIMKVADFINEIRQAGRNGELSGETFIFFNKQIKGNKREIIQLGVPLFQPTTEDANCHTEPIPLVLQAVIDHLVLWRLIPESRKPNSVVINFFDEDEHSQPYFKPPHLDNPICTLLLSETTMAFGRSLVTDSNGNYKGPLTLSLKQGSLLVMRGNSADMARHVVCPSSNRRVSITFARVRPSTPVDMSPLPSPTKAMTPWQPQPVTASQVPSPVSMTQKPPVSGAIIGYAPTPQAVLAPAAWGMAMRAPVMMVAAAPARPMVMASSGTGGGNISKRMGRSGTGVFLPWTVGPKRYNKHLPPRIQKRRFSAMMSPIEAQG
ncbi:oxidoreductase, 2OG-Fe oxygenase family protein [Zea mays]|uniref:Oxidoreductase, 2OG-Fe oxygenase family protein n=4 Tax=Zea mays TaxID=4577 RepID=A0A1D6M3U2_MAIZE|nr:oxidoreductase, 2OG-Fe oxygenase family protein [Zea mays]AQK85813.1 Oxidoreductase, 2OG-Fe oxygenase family protein [Zea mays]AQK85815.1 Oxidoreductase, 2OG-Fe oxygenase family protein [Zea mays]|eukprot:XP_008647787.1 oxidoreductase, 2OG-Fe oxygenase family protein isoform X1 [Zea mays]